MSACLCVRVGVYMCRCVCLDVCACVHVYVVFVCASACACVCVCADCVEASTLFKFGLGLGVDSYVEQQQKVNSYCHNGKDRGGSASTADVDGTFLARPYVRPRVRPHPTVPAAPGLPQGKTIFGTPCTELSIMAGF